MKKLIAFILSAAIVPALTLSTAAFAEDREDKRAGEQRTGEQHVSSKPAGAFYAEDVIGNSVKLRGSDDDVGEIQDLVISKDGSVIGVVVTTGSFLGLGGQQVWLGWDQIERTMEDDESLFYTDMDEEALRNAPAYQRD